MSSEVDSKTIKTTQDLLSKIIKKPVLSDKLLKRPPFRFLHDIFTNIIKSNGFMKGLYTDDEMVADNVKDKDAKIAYLQKALDVTGFIVGDIIEAKAAKIVAGLECDKTNLWLQIVAKSIITKKDSSDAVQRVLNGEKPVKSEKPPAKQQKTIAKTTINKKKELTNNISNNTNNKDTVNKQRRQSVTKDGKNDATKPRIRRESVSQIKATTSTSKPEPNNKTNSKPDTNGISTENIEADNSSNGNDKTEITRHNDIVNNTKDDETDDGYHNHIDIDSNSHDTNGKLLNGYPSNDDIPTVVAKEVIEPEKIIIARPETAAKSRRTRVSQPSARPPTARQDSHARPSSSRPAPPKVLLKTAAEEARIAEAEMEEKLRQQSVKPVQNLIIDRAANEQNNDDDQHDDSDLHADIAVDEQRLEFEAVNDIESKGSLVKQLVDTKKELEARTKGELVTSSGTDQAMYNRVGNREIEKLRQSIQSMSQCVNPLAKVLDYLQEDIDSMVTELKQWREECADNMRSYEKLRNSNTDDFEPLQNELNRIDSEIREQSEKIVSVKANIIRNEERLENMVTMISKPAFN